MGHHLGNLMRGSRRRWRMRCWTRMNKGWQRGIWMMTCRTPVASERGTWMTMCQRRMGQMKENGRKRTPRRGVWKKTKVAWISRIWIKVLLYAREASLQDKCPRRCQERQKAWTVQEAEGGGLVGER